MLRTQVYLTDEQDRGLKRLARQRGRSQSELIREAVDRLLAAHPTGDDWRAVLARTQGIWADRPEVEEEIAQARASFERRVEEIWPKS